MDSMINGVCDLVELPNRFTYWMQLVVETKILLENGT